MSNLQRLGTIVLILILSVVATSLSSRYKVTGSEAGQTRGLLSYSKVLNGELYYPPDYLRGQTIVREGHGCTLIANAGANAYGWPFYYKIDDLNCGSTKIFPVVYILNTIIFAAVICILCFLVVRLVRL